MKKNEKILNLPSLRFKTVVLKNVSLISIGTCTQVWQVLQNFLPSWRIWQVW
jgi:hypothetical protein